MAVMVTPALATPINTNIVAVVDESGSMGGEHAWLPSMITSLNAALLTAAGVDAFSATYGLTGFGGNGGHRPGHKHLVGGGDFGTAGQFGAAAGSLNTSGSHENGFQAINYALNNYGYTAGAVKNLILVTDEDSDGNTPQASVIANLSRNNALLNAVIDVSFKCGDGTKALGMSATKGYKADGSGGFTTCLGATAYGGFVNSLADYVDLALNTGGAAWDLKELRAGGNRAVSFTNAFVDVKVEEIITHVPEPTTVAFLGLGVLSMGMLRRQKKNNMDNLA
ncbi:VWA domain-containing protein [Moritella sp. 24]|nr:VWA domain-containing protein [Moritella sp. 24]